MLRGILAAQGNFKAHRAAQRPALWAFNLPVLARIPLADLLAHTRIFVNALWVLPWSFVVLCGLV